MTNVWGQGGISAPPPSTEGGGLLGGHPVPTETRIWTPQLVLLYIIIIKSVIIIAFTSYNYITYNKLRSKHNEAFEDSH